jgi:Copper binding proteins, plastocyanin/azurin family
LRRGAGAVGVVAAAVALALALAASAPAASAGRAHAAVSSYLQVTQVEYRLLLSRGVVKAGPVSLEEIDAGMDQHDLRLRHGRSKAVLAEPLLNPGQRWDGVVDLRPGVYHLWCSLPGHWKLGMRATLRVVR